MRREEQRIAVIANRVKKQTLIYKSLMKFLENLQIPVIATLRDSQAYIRSAETGQGIFEMKPTLVREDLEQWLPLVGWLAQRKPLHIEPGTPAITSALTSAPKAATTYAGVARCRPHRRRTPVTRAGRRYATTNSIPAAESAPVCQPDPNGSQRRRSRRSASLLPSLLKPRVRLEQSPRARRYLPLLSFSLSQLLRTLSVQLL